MKTRLLVCAVALLGLASAPPLAAQALLPAPAAAGEASSDAAIQRELSALVAQVRAKLEAGRATPAALAEELKAFEALRAKYADQKTDAAAMIGVMHALIYREIFDDSATALSMLKQLAADFSGSGAGKELPRMIAQIEEAVRSEAATAVGKELAPFKANGLDGRELDLAAHRGKIVLVNFWATWCGPCIVELPHLKATYEKYREQGFEIIGISLDRDEGQLAAFIRKHEMSWPQIYDGPGAKNKLAETYGIRAVPTTFLLDREGRIVAKSLRGDALTEKVGELLAAKP